MKDETIVDRVDAASIDDGADEAAEAGDARDDEPAGLTKMQKACL